MSSQAETRERKAPFTGTAKTKKDIEGETVPVLNNRASAKGTSTSEQCIVEKPADIASALGSFEDATKLPVVTLMISSVFARLLYRVLQ